MVVILELLTHFVIFYWDSMILTCHWIEVTVSNL